MRPATRSKFRYYVDRTVIYPRARWAGLLVFIALYLYRTYVIRGWYIVTYGLGIYLLNLSIGFLSPKVRGCLRAASARMPARGARRPRGPVSRHRLAPRQIDPETHGPILPTGANEGKGFQRMLPEFKFWCGLAVLCARARCGSDLSPLHR